MKTPWNAALEWAERGLAPDVLIRAGIRRLCAERLAEEAADGLDDEAFAAMMRGGPIAPVPTKANEQHYELPPEFFQAVLGERLKYSCCFWPPGVETLDQAEQAALEQTCRRAELADGQRILELGCGWGSLSLWIAERFPRSRVEAVSNSNPQREFIEAEARRRGLRNLRVITRDMNEFEATTQYDRVVSVEMFEHMRNWELLLRRVGAWLRPTGKAFLHVFCHRERSYRFSTEGAAEWMGRNFFTGGIMPGARLIDQFAADLRVTERNFWSGEHYRRTARAWLENLDRRRGEILPLFSIAYGAGEARRRLQQWRIFFMACEELWGFRGGSEWMVAHYRLEPTAVDAPDREWTDRAASISR